MNFYKNYISTHYNGVNTDFKKSLDKRYGYWRSALVDLIPSNKKIEILEIGSGMGHNLIALKKIGYKKITGIDTSPECVKYCKSLKLKVSQVKEREKDFFLNNKNKYDLIILYDVLEHLIPLDGCSILEKSKVSLKDDGHIFICVPNGEYPLNSKIMYADITHKFMYTESSLKQLISNAGFQVDLIKQTNSFSCYHPNHFVYLLRCFVFLVASSIGEGFWKFIGLLQGVVYRKCRPTLIMLAKK